MYAQLLDKQPTVDTLTVSERLSLRTNAIDWMLLTPNIGVEFDFKNTNWGRWAAGLDIRYNWNTSHTFSPGVVYNIAGVRLSVRNYYRMRKYGKRDNRVRYFQRVIDGVSATVTDTIVDYAYPEPHKGFLKRLFTCRTDSPKHPKVIFYRGAYVSYNKYSVKISKEGRQGNALTVGGSWGWIKPLYVFASGNSLDFEAGISAGFSYTKYSTYVHDRESNCYYPIKEDDWKFNPIPVISDLRVGFVYRFGKNPSSNKYLWRYDCDKEFREKVDEQIKQYVLRKDSLKGDGDVMKDLQEIFDRVYKIEAAKIVPDLTEDKATTKGKSKGKSKGSEKGKAKVQNPVQGMTLIERMNFKKQQDSITAAARRDSIAAAARLDSIAAAARQDSIAAVAEQDSIAGVAVSDSISVSATEAVDTTAVNEPIAPVEGEQPQETAPVEGEQPQETAPVEEEQSQETAPVEEEQPQEAAPVEEEQPQETAPVEEEQPQEAAPVEEEQPQEAAPVEEEQPQETAPVEEEQSQEAAPVEGEQPQEAAPVEGEQPQEAAPVEGEQPQEAAPVEGEQSQEAAPVEEEQSQEAAPVEETPVEEAPTENTEEAGEETPAEAAQGKEAGHEE